jgi:hypothetical protein
MDMTRIKTLVDEQANDPGLWFQAQTASEAYLQQELRRLHEAIEGVSSRQIGANTVRQMFAGLDASRHPKR